jgi:WW domain-containing oxidoreductase
LFSRLMMLAASLVEKTVEQGAATQCFVATHPSVEGKSGGYYSDCRRAGTSRLGKDEALAEELWNQSTELTKSYLD